MRARFIFLLVVVFTTFSIKSQGQEVTASLSDDLGIGKPAAVKQENVSLSFNKKVNLTNTEIVKSIVVRINDRVKMHDNNSMVNISNSVMDEIGVKSGKATVKVQEIQGNELIERFWASSEVSTSAAPILNKTVKEYQVDVETTKIEGFDMNHVYDLNGKMKDLSGFGLQIAAFGQLKAAKDFALKFAKNGDTEAENIFIQVSKSTNKPMVYRVVYGLFEQKANAEITQKKMENLGYNSFVKGF
jgi:hypothetical protein